MYYIEKNVYIDKLDDIVSKYNNRYHKTIKMKPVVRIDETSEVRIEKVIKKKGDKVYVKWKGYDNSFNSWIDKKDLV